MSDTKQSKTELTRNSYPYTLKIFFTFIIIASVNAIIFAFQLEQDLASVNLLLFSSIIVLFYAMGNLLDKKLVLWSIRFYRWTLNQGLLESVDSDAE